MFGSFLRKETMYSSFSTAFQLLSLPSNLSFYPSQSINTNTLSTSGSILLPLFLLFSISPGS